MIRRGRAALVAVIALNSAAHAQEDAASTLHWAYASFFGTGWYQLSEQQSAFIANFSVRWLTGDLDWGGTETQKTRYTVRVPFTVGVNQLEIDDLPGIIDLENFSTVSIGLSADVDIPLSRRWSVRPNAQVSYGRVIGQADEAYTYRADVRGRYWIRKDALRWAMHASLGSVAYDASPGIDDSFTYASIGTEFSHPVSWFSTENSQSVLHWHVLYMDLLDRIEVRTADDKLTEVTNFWQVGLAFGKRDERIKLGFLSFERLGLAYDISPTGDLRGIKFVFKSLYDP
jgi:hypothetical protein